MARVVIQREDDVIIVGTVGKLDLVVSTAAAMDSGLDLLAPGDRVPAGALDGDFHVLGLSHAQLPLRKYSG